MARVGSVRWKEAAGLHLVSDEFVLRTWYVNEERMRGWDHFSSDNGGRRKVPEDEVQEGMGGVVTKG